MEGTLKVGIGYGGLYVALGHQDHFNVNKMSSADKKQLLLDEYNANQSILDPTGKYKNDIKDITDPNCPIWSKLDHMQGGTLILDSDVLKKYGMKEVPDPESGNPV